jgi:hypothetical protein
MTKTPRTMYFAFSLLCLSCAPARSAQVGPRTTAPPPTDFSLVNIANGIKITRTPGISPEMPVLPAPAAPLEVGVASAQIQILTAAMNGSTKQTFCAGANTGVACAVAVRYKVGKTEKSIYLIRAGGKLVVVSPDKFSGEGQSGVLRKGSIVRVEEMGGKSASFDRDTQLIVSFEVPQ